MKSYWIWHFGDYEIYHTAKTNLRREERGCVRNPFWKVSMPYATVKFTKTFECESGEIEVYINGDGYVDVDGTFYQKGRKIHATAGTHTITVHVQNIGGLCAIYVKSDILSSDDSWSCSHYAADKSKVGTNCYFDSENKSPEFFPFSYEKKLPVAKEDVEGGTLYDFGTELFGFLNIDGCTAPLEIYYGESREEALDTEHTYITDIVTDEGSHKLTQRAFRFIFIKGRTDGVSLSCDFEYLPLTRRGSFKCSNPLFNDIYDISAYTFHLNCREAFLDGIKRDRWVWAGDTYQSARINSYLFYDKDIEQRTAIGLVGREPIEQHLNTIVDYSLIWLIGLYEHYMYYGEKQFLENIYPMAQALLRFSEKSINSDGFIEGKEGDWIFIDWGDIDKTGAVCAEQMLLIEAYSSMAKIAEQIGTNPTEYKEKSDLLKKKVNEYYWNEEAGAYIDSFTSGKKHVSRQTNIFALMYGIASERQAESILKNVLKNDSIAPITTPYFKGYELDVLAKMGEFLEVEKVISSYWGGMVKLGAKTIWEEYDPKMSGPL